MVYRIHRLRATQRSSFRLQPHLSGPCEVKPKEYEPDGEVEAGSVYAAWSLLKETPQPLEVGDLLEEEAGVLHICKFVGFEPASWLIPVVSGSPESTAESTPVAKV